MNTQLNRRSFLKAGAAGLTLAGAAPSFAIPQLQPEPITLNLRPARKALVFIMLDGGNDSFNMLVPTSDAHYRAYQQSRSNLALERDSLLPLHNNIGHHYQDNQGRTFGLHPSMSDVQQLFQRKKLAFVANVAPMIEPVSKAAIDNGTARLPLGLLSHADQFKHWQTSRPDKRINAGWFGYFADALQPGRALTQIPMNISLAGNNIMQNGVQSSHYSITDQGSVGLVVNEENNPLNNELLDSFETLLNSRYHGDPFRETWLSQLREAQAQHETFRRATEHQTVSVQFSDTPLSQQLRKVAQSIKAASSLNTPHQTFFLRYIGWDHHDELLNNHARMLQVLSQALGEFQQALDNMGLGDQVITFTGSDFGRTLTSNGNGTDHGWGGNTLVMGNSINGGEIFGEYPSLTLQDNPLNMGDGVLIPTTSTDQLYAELAHWFGVPRKQLTTLFPNLKHFNRQLLRALIAG
ncbi:MAG: DUF1501 domain-containing protein [Marinobacterium sp.]|nr:DUF1501 domain-containing protein [Marinobacterium sp.]